MSLRDAIAELSFVAAVDGNQLATGATGDRVAAQYGGDLG